MRNALVQALAAGTTLMVPVDPPLRLGELPFVFTASGRGSVVVRVVDSRMVAVHNPTNHLSPFFFFITDRPPALPRWLQTAVRILGGS